MDHIDRLFLSVKESLWLPQWSFDFWIIPYLIGKGISLAQFKEFMSEAHNLLTLEIASLPAEQKRARQRKLLENMVAGAKGWPQSSAVASQPVEAQHAISA
jgi:p-methyltransferase